jgi:N-dimethylarginine dimethylaminohydrolase
MFSEERCDMGADEPGEAADVRRRRWGVDSEYGRLTDVMLCVPNHLAPVPCCAATVAALRRGFEHSTEAAVEQHRALARTLELNGVRCHFVPAAPELPDLAFARDATLMTPWGLVELNLAAAHRQAEPGYVADAVRAWGVPTLGRVPEGAVEGGDVCLVRPGLVIIGCSGERTDEAGAASLAALFQRHGWKAIVYRFDPHFLHLDTQFTMLDASRALACPDVLSDEFLETVRGLGIELVPVTYKEVMRLGANVLSLGGGRIVASAESQRVKLALTRLGYEVSVVEIDQFTRCGGGVHCLTMPLAREPVATRSSANLRSPLGLKREARLALS